MMQCSSPETEFWEVPEFEVNNQHVLVTGGSNQQGRYFGEREYFTLNREFCLLNGKTRCCRADGGGEKSSCPFG
jgi:hypothetical protein